MRVWLTSFRCQRKVMRSTTAVRGRPAPRQAPTTDERAGHACCRSSGRCGSVGLIPDRDASKPYLGLRDAEQHFHWSEAILVGLGGLEPPPSSLSAIFK
jgi:hypothetical protein